MKKCFITALLILSSAAFAEEPKPAQPLPATVEESCAVKLAKAKVEIAQLKQQVFQLQAQQAYAATQKELADANKELSDAQAAQPKK